MSLSSLHSARLLGGALQLTSLAGCGSPVKAPPAHAAPEAVPRATAAVSPAPREQGALTGRWLPLPGRANGANVRHLALALGPGGAFLGRTFDRGGPDVLHGAWENGVLSWSAPWPVPLPPPRPGLVHWMTSWDAVGIALFGLALAIDRLDPMRIAVNRLEYQGGSYELVVGRWNEPGVVILPRVGGQSACPATASTA